MDNFCRAFYSLLILLFLSKAIRTQCSSSVSPDGCPMPTLPQHGSYVINAQSDDVTSGRIRPGVTVTYSCSSGYLPFGDNCSMCSPEGAWTGAAFRCVAEDTIRFCGEPPLIENALVINQEKGASGAGSVVVYRCLAGYVMTGAPTKTCTWTGTWTPEVIECRQATDCVCDPEGALSMTCTSSGRCICKPHFTGPECSGCVPGYYLNCEGRFKQCFDCACDQAGSLQTTCNQVTGNCFCKPHFAGQNCSDCAEGFYPVGAGASKQCLGPVCILPPLGLNVIVSSKGEPFIPGEGVFFSCPDGFTLFGQSFVTCQSSGVWDNHLPECQRRVTTTEPPPRTIQATRPNGRVCILPPLGLNVIVSSTGNPFIPGEGVFFSCPNGFTLSGPSFVKCQSSGVWDNHLPECQRTIQATQPNGVKCQYPRLPTGGILRSRKAFYWSGEVVDFTCYPGYERVGNPIIECIEGFGRARLAATCVGRRCVALEDPENGRMVGVEREINSTVRFTCHDGYTLFGSATRTCLENGRWSGQLTVCDTQRGRCPELGVPTGSYRTASRQYQVSFLCRRGFIKDGNATRNCLPNGTWSGRPFTCRAPNQFDMPVDVVRQLIQLQQRIRTQMSQIIFLMDISGSTREPEIEAQKAFIEAFSLDLPGIVKVVLTYNQNVSILARTTGSYDVASRLRSISNGRGATSLTLALNEVGNVLSSNKSLVIFAMMNGASNYGGHPGHIARTLKTRLRAEIFALGIDASVHRRQMASVSSRPLSDYLFFFKYSRHLSEVALRLSQLSLPEQRIV